PRLVSGARRRPWPLAFSDAIGQLAQLVAGANRYRPRRSLAESCRPVGCWSRISFEGDIVAWRRRMRCLAASTRGGAMAYLPGGDALRYQHPKGRVGPMSERDTDLALVERVQRGDKKAFDLLVLKYQRKIMRLLSRIIRDPVEVEDVAQEAFIKAYRALPQFRGESAFYTWLYRIAVNTAKNHLVSSKRRPSGTATFESEDGETFDQTDNLSDINTPEAAFASR